MSQTLLLIDDDDSLRKSLVLYLCNYGFDVQSVCSVKKAKSYLELYLPDLVIVDIMIPNTDGYQVIKFLRSNIRYSKIPFIFLTAKGMIQDKILGYNLGCYAYITKPFDSQELLAIINSILNNLSNLFQSSILESSIINAKKKLLLSNLTNREYSVLQLVLKGMTNRAIANSLTLSLRSVEKHVSKLLTKTHSNNRTELVRQFCFINNLIID